MANVMVGVDVPGKRSRLSYVNLFEPRSIVGDDGVPGEPRYSTVVLIPKEDTETIERLRKAEKETAEANKHKFKKGKVPANLASVIHDGDEEADLEENPEYAGHWYMNVGAKEKYPPKVVDRSVRQITDATEVYSGCYARVTVSPYAYSYMGKEGIGFGLRNVQKLAEGEPLGGVSRVEDDFEDLGEAEDDTSAEDLLG